MKTVLESSMVAHVWANQSQTHAKSGHGNFFFNDSRLWSYGSHFLVGKIMPDGAALLNSDSYSVTTSKHQSYASRAVRGARYSVPGLTGLDQTGALSFRKDWSAKSKKRALDSIKKHILTNAGAFSDDSALYLLRFAGAKDAAKVLTRLQYEARRKANREADDRAKAERKANLALGAGVTIEKTRAAFKTIETYQLARDIKKLFHVHKTLKAAKRVMQARVVWEALKLSRAELKRREHNGTVIAANKRAHIAIQDIRDGLESIAAHAGRNEMIDSRSVQNIITEMAILAGAAPRVAASFAWQRLGDGLRIALPLIEAEESRLAELEQAAEIAEWLAGGGSKSPSFGYSVRTMLRAVKVERDSSGTIIGGELQTSRGANVPLVHAIKAFRFLKLCRERGTGWTHNGHSIRVGHFQVDSIQPDGSFKAGCHEIEWSEVERVARSLDVLDLPPTDSALESTHKAA